MKKVIAALTALVILILGTAIGVAVNADQLKHKDVLSASDVQLALASQGMFAHRVAGDHSDMAISGVTPVVYKLGDRELVVYEYASAAKRHNAAVPSYLSIEDDQWCRELGSWRNLRIYSQKDIPIGQLVMIYAIRGDERLDHYFEQQYQRHEQLRHTLRSLLNDVRTKTIQIETEQMIYRLKQSAYCTPVHYGSGTWYDNWLSCQLIGCWYKEPPKKEELPTYLSLKGVGWQWTDQVVDEEHTWDGQGMFAKEWTQIGGQSLTKETNSVTYYLTFSRGDLVDREIVTVDWEE